MTPNGVEYVRVFPSQYDEDTENKFMRTVIDKFALEKKAEDGKPTGKFFMNKKLTQELGREVVEKSKNIHGKELDTYMT